MTVPKSSSVFLFAAALTLALASPAHATDGTVLITPAAASSGLPGCPLVGGTYITICHSGSYRLAGSLVVPAGETGISITADNVTLDLNGFSISAAVASHGSGIISNNSDITVENGAINSFVDGIALDYNLSVASDGDMVEGVTFISNAFDGVFISSGSIQVTNCRFINNGHAYGNGAGAHLGFYTNYSVVANVLNCLFVGNSYSGTLGLYFNSSVSGYGGSTIADGVSGGTSMGTNVCRGAHC